MKHKCESNLQLFRETVNLEFFKVFFEPIRYELIEYIWMNPNQNIGEISACFKQDRSVISRHLEVLFRHDILLKTKESRYTYYKVNGDYILEKFENFTSILKILPCHKE